MLVWRLPLSVHRRAAQGPKFGWRSLAAMVPALAHGRAKITPRVYCHRALACCGWRRAELQGPV